MEEEHKALFKDAFGESSDSEDELLKDSGKGGGISQLNFGEKSPTWEPIREINGLWLCRDFLSPHHQSSLLSSIEKEGWFTEASHNQAMRFGDLPAWATELSNSIRKICYGGSLSSISLLQTYTNQGICPHVDLMRFEDGIAILSLESSCVMHFSRAEIEISDSNEVINKEGELRSKIPVHLEPGSLILMWGEARYKWKHEINRKPGFQVWQGKEIDQKRRTSLTLRRLCKS